MSPLKALSYDVERNLRAPLRGIGADVTVAVRTGDTPQKERRDMLREPPDILITTPESLYLMLTSQARRVFEGDRVGDPRRDPRGRRRPSAARTSRSRSSGSPRQAEQDVQRIGLSATQNPLEEVGRFMVGPGRKCTVVDTGVRKPMDLQIQVPVESMVEPEQTDAPSIDPLQGGEATRKSIWPAIYPKLLELVQEHRSTIVFVNNRRGAERLALRLNDSREKARRSPAPTTARSPARSARSSRSS